MSYHLLVVFEPKTNTYLFGNYESCGDNASKALFKKINEISDWHPFLDEDLFELNENYKKENAYENDCVIFTPYGTSFWWLGKVDLYHNILTDDSLSWDDKETYCKLDDWMLQIKKIYELQFYSNYCRYH